MLLLASTSDKVQVVTSAAVTVDVHASYMDMASDGSGNPSTGRKNTAISTAATTDVVLAPAASSTTRNVKTLHIRNRHASSSVDVTVVHTDGTTPVELHKTTLLAGEALEYAEGVGFFELGASSPTLGGIGTPATASQSLTAGSANVVNGTLVQLPTGNLKVGSRFKFHMNVIKTAAGTATWTAVVKYGTAGTTSDAAIATFTSGTNTAASDQANLIIEATITALGAAATANCIAMFTNTLTDITGLGRIPQTPGSTATFDSTAANPFLHVDITPGASAVMTTVAASERLA
jgi:hypothetical protein